jgi:hypothetical protein
MGLYEHKGCFRVYSMKMTILLEILIPQLYVGERTSR